MGNRQYTIYAIKKHFFFTQRAISHSATTAMFTPSQAVLEPGTQACSPRGRRDEAACDAVGGPLMLRPPDALRGPSSSAGHRRNKGKGPLAGPVLLLGGRSPERYGSANPSDSPAEPQTPPRKEPSRMISSRRDSDN